ncbi:MAG: hypothetical protein AMXMBFR57_06650 [Acidimicrobiia bacterium]
MRRSVVAILVVSAAAALAAYDRAPLPEPIIGADIVRPAVAYDRSPRLDSIGVDQRPVVVTELDDESDQPQSNTGRPAEAPKNAAGASVEQTSMGTGPSATLVRAFDGLGASFTGPQGSSTGRNPSDNSLAVGPRHVMQSVNTRMAVFDKQGAVFWGAVPNNTVFRGFTGMCDTTNNGDTVVRYDQLANRWLIVMPIFRRGQARPDQPPVPSPSERAVVSTPGVAGQPGAATRMFVPPAPPPPAPTPATPPSPAGSPAAAPPRPTGPYSMCYAISVTDDPLGEYYRYEFLRPLFPDYPRPAVWPDGYYVPTSTGDDVIEKHACVVDRQRMLRGEAATEQCVIVPDVNFLNNADLDGSRLPPAGAPNPMLATGGSQLKGDVDDDGVYVWNFHVDWADPAKTRLTPVVKVPVAPYHYLCDGQLTSCVPQPGTERRLDAQGDKLMARVVYRNLSVNGQAQESIVALHSVNTEAAAGGVRWYEFRVNEDRSLRLHQQSTYAPDAAYRWMASPAMDRFGNIGIGYSFGGTPHYAGQRFAARRAADPLGQLTLREVVLAEGADAQTYGLRWEDYTQTAVDPEDDCTIWYVGDYYRKGDTNYSTKIGAFRIPPCGEPGVSAPLVASFGAWMLSAPPASLKLDPFYEKHADAYGIPVVASGVVADDALLMARDIVNYMLSARPDVRAEMVKQGYKVGIIGRFQGQADLPEYRTYKKPAIDDRRLTPGERERYNLPGGIASMTDAEYWNRRARGLGGRYTTAGEENILGIPGTRYFGEHILVHEFSHGIHSALRTADPAMHAEIQQAYDAAKAKGLFKGHYAENTVAEYWAEGTQWWFWSNFAWTAPTGERLASPESLKAYDPTLFALLGRVYASHHIPGDVYYGRAK